MRFNEGFYVHELDLAKIRLKKVFQLLDMFCMSENEGDRTGWTKHEPGIGHTGSCIGEERTMSWKSDE